MSNLEYINVVTNTESVLKLIDLKNLEANEKYTLIGLNIIAKSLALPLDPYRDRHDTTARVRDSLTIAKSLSEIVDATSQLDFNPDSYINELISSLFVRFGDPIQRYGIKSHLIAYPLNEISKVFYNSGKSYEELGKLVEVDFINEN